MTDLKTDSSTAPEEARELLATREVAAFDIRPSDDFEAGWIAGAKHVDENDLDAEIEKIEENAVLIICADGAQSEQVAARLRDQGAKATYLEGGFAAWADEDLPTQPSDDFGEAVSSKHWDKR